MSPRSVEEHLRHVLGAITPIDPIELTTLDAQGLLLADDIHADLAIPAVDCAETDGYAIRAIDTRDAHPDEPVEMPVVADVVTGVRSSTGVGPGIAARITTGAAIPAGADAVVAAELTDRGVARVQIRTPVHTGDGIRRAGEDLQKGQKALNAGSALGPQQIALLAGLGRERVTVRPRPRVVTLSVGSELVDLGRALPHGDTYDSNSHMIAAAARDAGADAYRVGIVPDDHARLVDVLESQLLRADVLVTTGGISHGASDVVRSALSELGTVEFFDVAMDPGRYQGFGAIGSLDTGRNTRVPIFCLPGSPGGALVSFEVFVRPVIRRLLGKHQIHRAAVQAIALERMESPPGVRSFRRGLLHREANGGYSVSLVGRPGAHLLASMASSNCLVVVDEAVTEVVAGSRVTTVPLLLSHR